MRWTTIASNPRAPWRVPSRARILVIYTLCLLIVALSLRLFAVAWTGASWLLLAVATALLLCEGALALEEVLYWHGRRWRR